MDGANQNSTRKYPAYTTAQLEAFVAAGQGNPVMIQEICLRKAGSSIVTRVPQIERLQTKRHMYKTAQVVNGNFLYPVGSFVSVEYAGYDGTEHFFAISFPGKPGCIVRESSLTSFVL
jgi:hypothetical protein